MHPEDIWQGSLAALDECVSITNSHIERYGDALEFFRGANANRSIPGSLIVPADATARAAIGSVFEACYRIHPNMLGSRDTPPTELVKIPTLGIGVAQGDNRIWRKPNSIRFVAARIAKPIPERLDIMEGRERQFVGVVYPESDCIVRREDFLGTDFPDEARDATLTLIGYITEQVKHIREAKLPDFHAWRGPR